MGTVAHNVKRGIYRSLLTGTALAVTSIGFIAAGPATAQCASDAGTTTCTSSGNPYAAGIAIVEDDDALLVLEDGVSIAPDPEITGVSLTAGGKASLSTRGGVSVATTGDNATAVAVTGGGDVDVTVDQLSTDGADAPALAVTSGGFATIAANSIVTTGERSDGIIVDATTGVSVKAGTIATSGNGSSGVTATSDGAINLDLASIVIDGSTIVAPPPAGGEAAIPDRPANGVNATSSGGDITVAIGSLTQNGNGAGVVAATDRGGISVVVRGSAQGGAAITGGVKSLDGPALDLSAIASDTVSATANGDPARAGTVAVTVDRGATVSTAYGPAIRILAEKSSSVTNNGTILRESWTGDSAVQISGGQTTIVNNGTIAGTIRLTENADTYTNNGIHTTSGVNSFDDNETVIGAMPNRGVDTLVNTGTIRVDPLGDYTQYPVFAGVEVFRNSGLIDLRSKVAGDQAFFGRTLVNVAVGAAPVLGQYIASGNATIALDLQFQETGALSDMVKFNDFGGDVGSPLSVSGTTKVAFNLLGNNTPRLLIGLPVIYVPSGSTGTFELAQPMVMGGLQFALIYDPRQSAWALYSAPGAAVLRQIKLPTNVQALWHRASDVVSAHLRVERDRRWSDAEPQSRLWMQAIGDSATRTETYSATVNRIAVSGVDFSQRQSIYGLQAGIDSAGPEAGETGMIFGATVGYLQSTAQFRATRERFKIDAFGAGAYASLLAGPAFLTVSANYARHSIDDRLSDTASNGKIRGDSYGVRTEAGIRLGGDAFFVEPSASITYAVTAVDRVAVRFGQIAFQDLTSNNGVAGVRLGGRTALGDREVVYYAGGEAVREFAGDDGASLAGGNLEVSIPTNRLGTYGRATAGLNLITDTRMSIFVEGQGVFGKGYSGGGGRLGIRLPL